MRTKVLLTLWLSATALWNVPALEAPQGPLERGVKVTYETVRGDKVRHTQRNRLLSLAVERGEVPTPFLPPGAFRATMRAVVTLPARDRMRFKIDGNGKARLSINGKQVLDGRLRRGQSLETDKAVRLKKGGNDLEIVFESAARGDGQLRVFWSGYEFGYEPIRPEQLAYPSSDADVVAGERLRHGHTLFVERRCARCHEFDNDQRLAESAFLELDRPGPDLRRVSQRVQKSWLVGWLLDPRQVAGHATMPKYPLAEQQARDIAAFLGTLGEPLPHGGFDQQLVPAGAKRFRELGCVACHLHRDEAPAAAKVGDRIDLRFVAGKWHASALVSYLQKPSEHYSDIRMPDLKVSADDATALAAYLLQDAAVAAAPAGDVKAGRRLVQKHGCVKCHELGDDIPPADRVFPRLANLKPARGCLADEPGGAAPDHGFDDDQRAALRAFLPFAAEAPFRQAPLDFIARHMRAERCFACHAIDGEPSTWARLASDWSQQRPLPREQDPVAQGVPSLTWVGAKLQPSWIAGFVTGELPSPRPWLTARMPAFGRHGESIATGLVREHGYDSRDERIQAGGADLLVHGERLIKEGSGFGCVQCHAVGDQKATQVFEREGINLLVARKRLRREFYMRWMGDPDRLDPDARMPKFVLDKGRTAYTDILGGKADAQFDAIWQYLGDRAK